MRRIVILTILTLAAAGCGGDAESAATTASLPPSPSHSQSATPDQSPTPRAAQPEATPNTNSTGEVGWEAAATVAAPDASGMLPILAGFDHGYVVVTQWPPTAWFSPDGVTWTSSRLKVKRGLALGAPAIASDGTRIVVGGSYTPCKQKAFESDPFDACRPRPISWISDDGRTWEASPAWDGPIGERGRSGSLFVAVWPVPTGGWDAAQGFDMSDESDDLSLRGPGFWHSADGVTWSKLRGAPSADAETCLTAEGFHAVADSSGRRVAVTDYAGCPPSLLASSNGKEYQTVASFTPLFTDTEPARGTARGRTSMAALRVPGQSGTPARQLRLVVEGSGSLDHHHAPHTVWRGARLLGGARA